MFPLSSTSLIKDLGLVEHPEKGYFTLTDIQSEQVPSPFAGGQNRQLATSIYYLLTFEQPSGVFHMNKSATYHVLHQGRAEYTLITPGNPPVIEKRIIGCDTAAGETRMLMVGTGIWKKSTLIEEDILAVRTEEQKEATNCLITEVVVPGFDWNDHVFMDGTALRALFDGVEGGEDKIREFSRFTME